MSQGNGVWVVIPPSQAKTTRKEKKESAGQITVYVRCLSLFIIIIQPIGIILMKTSPSHGRRCVVFSYPPISTCVYYTCSRSSTKDLIQSSQHSVIYAGFCIHDYTPSDWRGTLNTTGPPCPSFSIHIHLGSSLSHCVWHCCLNVSVWLYILLIIRLCVITLLEILYLPRIVCCTYVYNLSFTGKSWNDVYYIRILYI